MFTLWKLSSSTHSTLLPSFLYHPILSHCLYHLYLEWKQLYCLNQVLIHISLLFLDLFSCSFQTLSRQLCQDLLRMFQVRRQNWLIQVLSATAEFISEVHRPVLPLHLPKFFYLWYLTFPECVPNLVSQVDQFLIFQFETKISKNA